MTDAKARRRCSQAAFDRRVTPYVVMTLAGMIGGLGSLVLLAA